MVDPRDDAGQPFDKPLSGLEELDALQAGIEVIGHHAIVAVFAFSVVMGVVRMALHEAHFL
jgi:hypothetical protein